MDAPTVNPYAPMPASTEAAERRLAPRWLAILLSLVSSPFAGAGLLVLRRSKRDWLLPAAGVVLIGLYGLAVATAPRLVGPALAGLVLLWLAGVVLTCLARPGDFKGWPKTLALAVAIVVVAVVFSRGFRSAAIESFKIPAGSMAPALLIGDHILVSKASRAPARGDVIVFKYPLGPSTDYIKRVIGLPGETIEMQRNQILIDGKPLPRRFVDGDCAVLTDGHTCEFFEERAGKHVYQVVHEAGRPPMDFGPRRIPAGSYFVVGDNRDNSNDSRVWGMVPAANIKGRATTIWYSPAPGGTIRWERTGKPID